MIATGSRRAGQKMSKQQGKYELLKEDTSLRKKHTYIQGCLLLALCTMSSVAVYATWTMIYRQNVIIPPTLIDIPPIWRERLRHYANSYHTIFQQQHYSPGVPPPVVFPGTPETDAPFVNVTANLDLLSAESSTTEEQRRIKELENERILPSKFGNFIYSREMSKGTKETAKIVCYYTTPSMSADSGNVRLRSSLYPERIDPYLCTHLNVGVIGIVNGTLFIDQDLRAVFNSTRQLKKANRDLKVLLWVGGGGIGGFSEMVANHASRKQFIKSLKENLELYQLDGVDLDWEFPGSGNKNRMHFSQLLHEIRREYQREHRTYILSVAVAAPATIAYLSYDVREINSYADYVNIMTYDYHFYSGFTPQTGLNAPLYRRHNEHSIFGTLNINASVHYWLSQGLEKSKIVIGLPTYGHSFRLVSSLNTRIGAPAADFGRVGMVGFASYSEICWFRRHNIYVHQVYDVESCSPYLYAGTEWISYEDERSLECKANYIKDNGFGGAMIFSLNTDDFGEYCADNALFRGQQEDDTAGMPLGSSSSFPLLRKIHSVLTG
ncbi:chitinase-3-like protein 1 [Toxorhynchites rutilus septentrionalis]|uniref:chitinase-3-like protein 1 n=1 Tax=Toxorhynchites rutilus septentrionalis TaxID=329112 RepID=UPI0024791C6A|nr:chitinase-3-like protein 1 [Toxorhynchites rutilus septentrionalis]XP_055624512.1 chitinase-3-like protein 1 [Toxorhynchites rutilus septentrionalis]